jgi:hypothetical protein
MLTLSGFGFSTRLYGCRFVIRAGRHNKQFRNIELQRLGKAIDPTADQQALSSIEARTEAAGSEKGVENAYSKGQWTDDRPDIGMRDNDRRHALVGLGRA